MACRSAKSENNCTATCRPASNRRPEIRAICCLACGLLAARCGLCLLGGKVQGSKGQGQFRCVACHPDRAAGAERTRSCPCPRPRPRLCPQDAHAGEPVRCLSGAQPDASRFARGAACARAVVKRRQSIKPEHPFPCGEPACVAGACLGMPHNTLPCAPGLCDVQAGGMRGNAIRAGR